MLSYSRLSHNSGGRSDPSEFGIGEHNDDLVAVYFRVSPSDWLGSLQGGIRVFGGSAAHVCRSVQRKREGAREREGEMRFAVT